MGIRYGKPMRKEIHLQVCPACGRYVPGALILCDWCDWELPDESDKALQRWNRVMDQLNRPELKNILSFGHGCGCICEQCRERYYGHYEICPIQIATTEHLYGVVMSWAIHNQDKVEPGQTMKQWGSQLSQFAKMILLYKVEIELKEVVEDAKVVEDRTK